MSKVLIVGGVAGGASAAARLRRLDESLEIIMFERGAAISYANCGLPYYVGGSIVKRDSLFLKTPEGMATEFNMEVRVNSEVIAVDSAAKKVLVREAGKGEYEEAYDYLLLAPGAKALIPPLPGLDDPRIVSIRTVPDTDKAYALAHDQATRRAIVVGGGFIGLEMAENLSHLGLEVHLVEMQPHVLMPLDDDMAIFAERELQRKGISLHLGCRAEEFKSGDKEISLRLNTGEEIAAEMVVLALGVRPDTAFLKDSGLEMGPAGHILIDEHMRTSAPGVYAVGDAVAFNQLPEGAAAASPLAVPLAGPANRQGRIAADNIAGGDSRYPGFAGTSIVKVFDLTLAATGLNARTLSKAGIAFQQVVVHPADHATYYPGAKTLTLKLLFSPEGKILGAQGAGMQGVDKRIDVLATAIRLGGSVSDLVDLELSYAPPFSSAKDPVNLLAYVAENTLTGKLRPVSYSEYQTEWSDKPHTLLDVRTIKEFESMRLENSVNLPLHELRSRLGELDRNLPIIVVCQVGRRAYEGLRILVQNGFDAYLLSGGGTSVWGHKPGGSLPCAVCQGKASKAV